MKRLLCSVLSLIMVLGVFLTAPVTVNAAKTEDLTFLKSNDGKSYYVSDCKESATGDIVIPETYMSKPVIGIGEFAFAWCSELTSVTLTENITYIGESAFYNCKKLEEINLPYTVKTIGDGAFFACESLTDITIGDRVEK